MANKISNVCLLITVQETWKLKYEILSPTKYFKYFKFQEEILMRARIFSLPDEIFRALQLLQFFVCPWRMIPVGHTVEPFLGIRLGPSFPFLQLESLV